jgi:hypothetical protein
MLLVGPAASASGAAHVRLAQAAPGAGEAHLLQGSGDQAETIGRLVSYGQVGGYSRVKAGQVTLGLRQTAGAGTPSARARLRDGERYTVVAMGGGRTALRVLQDGRGRPGASQLRVVHVAPELGRVEVRLGSRIVAGPVGFRDVADYRRVDPGAYAVRVTRPGSDGTVAAQGGVPLTAGTASTAFVVGSGGEPVSVVVAADRSAAPQGAPRTGLGGLADGDGPPIFLAILTGLMAALAGAAGYMAFTGRSRGRDT